MTDGSEPADGTKRGWRDAVFAAATIAVIVATVYIHERAALTYPVPSGDEALFVYQAHAFETSNSFVAPELDPARPILLLPLTYPGIVGLVFKVTGCSLETARYVSLAFFLLGFLLLVALARRHAAPLTALVVTIAFLMNGHFVYMANAVRMEPVFFAMLAAALWLLQARHAWTAIALLSITPMIHPNGVLYVVPVLAYAFIALDLRHTRPARVAWILFGVAAAVWIAHGIYVLRYWDGFMHDTAHRFGEMAVGTGKNGMSRVVGWPLVELCLIGATAAISARRKAGAGYLLAFAIGAWLHSRLRFETPYEPFADLMYVLWGLALVQIVARAIADSAQTRRYLTFAPVAAALAFMALAYKNKRIAGPNNYLSDLDFVDNHVGPPGAYFRGEDRTALRNFLATIQPGRPITVETYPWSEGLLFADFSDARVNYAVPYFDPLFRPAREWLWGYGPTPAPVPDVYIVRVSRYTPGWLAYRADSMFARAARHPDVSPREVIYARDSTEIWYAMRGPVPQR